MFTRGSWPEKKSAVGAAQCQEPARQEGICDFSGRGGWNGTKVVSVCWRHGSGVGRNCSWPTHPSWWDPAFSNKLAAGQRAIWGCSPSLGLSASAGLLQECRSVIGCAPGGCCTVHLLTNDVQTFQRATVLWRSKWIPRVFLGRGSELLWHVGKIWRFVWDWSVDAVSPCRPSHPFGNKNPSLPHCLVTSLCLYYKDEFIFHEFWLFEHKVNLSSHEFSQG